MAAAEASSAATAASAASEEEEDESDDDSNMSAKWASLMQPAGAGAAPSIPPALAFEWQRHVQFFSMHLKSIPQGYESLVSRSAVAAHFAHRGHRGELACLSDGCWLTRMLLLRLRLPLSQDTSRMTLLYFCLSALDVLGALDAASVSGTLQGASSGEAA